MVVLFKSPVTVLDCACCLCCGTLTVKPTPMKMQIIPIVMYAQQRLRGSALPTEDLPKSEPETDPVSDSVQLMAFICISHINLKA